MRGYRISNYCQVVVSVCENLLKTVGGSRWPEEPLCLAVVWPVERVDEVRTVRP